MSKMAHSNMNSSNTYNPPRNNARNTIETPIGSTIENSTVLSPVGTNTAPVSTMVVSSIPSQGVTPPPQPQSSPFSHAVARPMLGDAREPFQLGFSMPINNREHPYGVTLQIRSVNLIGLFRILFD